MFVDTLIIKYVTSEGVNIVRQNKGSEYNKHIQDNAKVIQKILLQSEIIEGKVTTLTSSSLKITNTLGRNIFISKNNDLSIKLNQEIRVLIKANTNDYLFHE